MQLEPDACFRATRSRDSRFDGRFYVGITSTRIYCRPVCSARPARRENQRYFASAAAAEGAGFRPCLLCRPELAPGLALIDASRQLARAAASLIDDGVANEGGLEAVARRLGVTDRHLRRVFEAEFGVTPVAYMQTARLLLAKRLLTDTQLPVTDIALAAGFGSVRRFNTLFAERYRLQPTALRRVAPASTVDSHRFLLATRPPFDYARLLEFFAARAVDGAEVVDGRRLRRSLRMATADGKAFAGWVEVRPAARAAGIDVRIDARLAPVIPRVLAACKRAFDLDCQPDAIAAVLGELAADRPGLRLPGAFDGFELATRAILGQQVSVKSARTLAGRLVARFGTPIGTPFAGVDLLFPDAATLAQCAPTAIAALGIVGARARAIVALAQEVTAGRIRLDAGDPVDETLGRLRLLPGLGEWTVQYIAMRALHWPDAFPAGDIGVLRALGLRNARAAEVRAEGWRPWRSYAVMQLWQQEDA
jgi:AraC family transcriptional regulator of adaptative response / DNA-3-methyladenine glycosylase II